MKREASPLFGQFFHPEAKVTIEGDNLTAEMPDGRRLVIVIGGMTYDNPNAETLPPFDFRDQLGKEG